MLHKITNGVRAFLRAGAPSGAAATPANAERPSGDEQVLTCDPSSDSPCPPGPILTLDTCPVCGGSLLPLKAPNVLEIRSRLGSISAMLQRLHGASCSAMTLLENQRFLIEEVYGFPAACPIDCDTFSIPFDGPFDLIISNHMLTHSVRPKEFLATVRDHLTPGGHLYLYQEPLEGEFLERGKSMSDTLNPFHLQTFNQASAVRALEATVSR
jgi:SAM-dependent methyltransferase